MTARQIPYHTPISVTPEESLSILQQEYELAHRRRSVRMFSDRPVPRDLIEQLIMIAGTAPSGANLQPWLFVAIDDAAIKKQVRIQAERVEKAFYQQRAAPEWLTALAPLATTWHKPFLELAPWLLIVFRQRWQTIEGQLQKTYYSTESVGIAVGLFIAAVHRAGLVTLTHTPAPMGFLRTLCGRPDNETPYVLLPVGYPAEECTVPDITRKTLDQIVQWNCPTTD